jgi:ribosomal protein L15
MGPVSIKEDMRGLRGQSAATHQIWAAFASPQTPRSKYVGPLGHFFPSPIKKEMNQTATIHLCRTVEDALTKILVGIQISQVRHAYLGSLNVLRCGDVAR